MMSIHSQNSVCFRSDFGSVTINLSTSDKFKRRRSIADVGQAKFLRMKQILQSPDLKISFMPETRRKIRAKLVGKGIINSTLVFGSSIKAIHKVSLKDSIRGNILTIPNFSERSNPYLLLFKNVLGN